MLLASEMEQSFLRLKRRFALMGLILALTLAVGTAGFRSLEGFSVLDAFYMTLITMTTIGYSEVHPLTDAGRIFNSVFIIFSVTSTFFVIGMLTQAIVELELSGYFSNRRVRRMIENLNRHFIVCGYGRVGRRASEELSMAKAPFVIIDIDPALVEAALRGGYLAVAADSTRDQTLLDVGVERARGLIAALPSDADNLFVVLSAKNLNRNLKVSARAVEEEASEKLRRAGADVVFAPYIKAGHQLAQSLLKPHVVEFLDLATQGVGPDISMEQLLVDRHSSVAGKSLAETRIRREHGVIVLAIRKSEGQMLFNPPAEALIAGGDYLIVMGKSDGLEHMEKLLSAGIGNHKV